jgi:hypothetical protein
VSDDTKEGPALGSMGEIEHRGVNLFQSFHRFAPFKPF